MKCSQADDLIDKYIEGRLSIESANKLEEHIKECDRCRRELYTRKSVYILMTNDRTIKAPDGFEKIVMSAIEGIDSKVIWKQHAAGQEKYNRVYRRLGISMVISACIMLFSVSLPVYTLFHIENFAAKGVNAITKKTVDFSETFYKSDYMSKSFISGLNSTLKKYGEGY